MIRCDTSKTLGRQEKCPQLEIVALALFPKKIQCKSCIKSEESKRGFSGHKFNCLPTRVTRRDCIVISDFDNWLFSM